MEGLFYCYENTGTPTFHLLRFYPESGYVLSKELNYEQIDDVEKMLKKFGLNGHILIGEPEFIYWGAFSEYDDKLKFKVENEIMNPGDTWVEYDLRSFVGKIISNDELQFEITSKHRLWTKNRTYKRVTGNQLIGE